MHFLPYKTFAKPMFKTLNPVLFTSMFTSYRLFLVDALPCFLVCSLPLTVHQ